MPTPNAALPTSSASASRHDRATPLVVIGADVLIAARPATPVQVAHACHALGYAAVIPSSWGDELLAAACLEQMERRGGGCAVFCACPRVAHRLLSTGSDLAPALVSLVPPPVAVARYLRAAHAPARLRITYVGGCPAGGDDVLDARLTPQELFDTFLDHGIVLSDQPTVFDEVLPADRRRHLSVPGGAPAPEVLAARVGAGLRLTGAQDLTLELTQALLEGRSDLLDPAPHLACSCTGVVYGLTNGDARQQVAALEPPRSPSPIVDAGLLSTLELQLPLAARSPADLGAGTGETAIAELQDTFESPAEPRPATSLLLPAVTPPRHSPMRGVPMIPALPAEEPIDLAPMPRRRSPAQGIVRPMVDTPPTTRAIDGRLLPRAYVARRKPGPWREHPVRPAKPDEPA